MTDRDDAPMWTQQLPTEYGGHWWWKPAATSDVTMVRVVQRHDGLAAGPWAGGLDLVAKMGGSWLRVEPPA